MEIGIDSFASAMYGTTGITPGLAMKELLERIALADQAGLSVFGIGEHHKNGFLDSAPAVILAAAAARTKQIRLTSAVAVLGAADPVRLFQSFATLDIISQGRAEMVVGRGSSVEAYPLFGLNLSNYDELFSEKLNLLLEIRKNEFVTWHGKFRASIDNLPIYPRPLQEKLPVWLGVGGTPASFERAGRLGLPLMVAVIGGFTERFRPLIDIYRQAGAEAGFSADALKVGLHSPGYVAADDQSAITEYYPGHVDQWNRIGRERGWAPITRAQFEFNVSPRGVLVVGGPETVAEKIINHSKSLGGIQRFTFQMDNAGLSHSQLMNAIELIGSKVIPMVSKSVVD
ncbi:Atu2307/SP_0267 family LLM class monooxygenase [Pedobacter zeae]|nr:Atu2307/SP_0267 family LLM class monooxygenase [Pedobacter zeae]MBB4106694.1 putative LLM family oxidoreductase [Pedobacter zeae]